MDRFLLLKLKSGYAVLGQWDGVENELSICIALPVKFIEMSSARGSEVNFNTLAIADRFVSLGKSVEFYKDGIEFRREIDLKDIHDKEIVKMWESAHQRLRLDIAGIVSPGKKELRS